MGDDELRDLFAFGAMVGQIMRNGTVNPTNAYETADAMIEARYTVPEVEPEEGIVAIKPKRKTTK